jgi:hypothetical protein
MQEKHLEVLKIELLDVASRRPPNGSHREQCFALWGRRPDGHRPTTPVRTAAIESKSST